ncbi:MAG: hypothetical protein PHS12_06335 [Candidatus Omnitrophica bacterium]|nr:hypothetical protein [Candidatus Omnitrophota bacterium]
MKPGGLILITFGIVSAPSHNRLPLYKTTGIDYTIILLSMVGVAQW